MVHRPRTALLAAVLVLGLSGTVHAQHAHFVGKVTATLTAENDAQVCWKEAGLGNNALIEYTATADGTSTFVCVNHGGQCPNAANKITVHGPVSATGTFSSGQNGQITQCLTIDPPGPGTFACPGGQTRTLADVSFTNLSISDDTNDIVKDAAPVTLAATLFVCP
jgi:hypothetical protein